MVVGGEGVVLVGGGRPLYRKLRGKYGMGDSVHARRRSEVSRNARSGRRNDDRESLPYLDTAKSGDRFRIGTRAHLGKKAGPSPEKAADPPPAPKPQWVRDQGFCAIGNGGAEKSRSADHSTDARRYRNQGRLRANPLGWVGYRNAAALSVEHDPAGFPSRRKLRRSHARD